jgi:hypothetical protein
MLKVKKSILYTVFLALALNSVSVQAMGQKNTQKTIQGMSAWFQAGAVLAITILASYALFRGAEYIKEKTERDIKSLEEGTERTIQKFYANQSQAVKNEGLLQAIKKEDLDDVKSWIGAGADVNTVDDETDTPALVNALGNLPIFTYLIAQPNLNINLITEDDDGDNHSVLMQILNSCSLPSEESLKQVVQLVLAHPQLVIDLKDNHNQTALMYAAEDAPASVVRLLLDKGANPNQANLMGMTALMISAREADIEKVKLLLEFGANPQASTEDNEHIEGDEKNKTVLELIRDIFIPQERAKLAGRTMSLIDRAVAFPVLKKIKKYLEIYDYIFSFMLRDITPRNARQKKVAQELQPVIGDPSWIVNQYLQNESSSEDVG